MQVYRFHREERDAAGRLQQQEVEQFMPGDFQAETEFEDWVNDRGNEMKRKMAQGWLNEQGESLMPSGCPRCGQGKLESRDVRSRTIRYTFGEVMFRRRRFECKKCGASVYPLDEKLGVEKKGG